MFAPNSDRRCRVGAVSAMSILLGVIACENPQPPAACGAIPQVTVNAGERITVTACFNDPNADMLTYSATSSNSNVATASISGTSVTVTAVAPGNTSVTVTATDPDGLQGQQSFQVMVPNRPPQPRGTIPSVSVPVGRTTTIDASSYFTEPDGETLTYGATSSNPAVATVTVAGSTVTVTAVAKGMTNVTVTATDPGGLTATQTVQSTVPNRGPEPVGTIPDQTVDAGETVTLDVSQHFSDPDADALTYSVTSSSSRVARGSISGSALTISAVAPGSATLTVTARDQDGATAQQRFGVTVPQSGPDLEFTNVTPTSATGAPGDTVTARFTVRNSGIAASGATTLRLYQSTSFTIDASDRQIGSGSFAALAAGGTRTVEASFILSSQASGTAYFGICIDAVPGESNTQNNCSRSLRVTIGSSGSPDLVVSHSKSSVTVSPGGSFSYGVTVRNQGSGSSAATLLRHYLSSDATISKSDREFADPSPVRSLRPSTQVSGTFTVTVTADSPAGTAYIGQCVDAVTGESDTGNNCSTAITVTIQPGGGTDTTYTTGQTITTLPTGFWIPNKLSGGSYEYSGSTGIVTITLNGTSSYMVHDKIRYSCLSIGGCRIVNRRVTKGSIRARAESSSNLIAGPEWDSRILRVVGTTVLEEPGGGKPVPWATASLRVLPPRKE